MAQDVQDVYTPTISKITLPSGNSYWLKDKYARERLEALASALYFAGVTSTPISEGSTNPVITIGGNTVTAENGCVVIYNDPNAGSREFVWTETTPGDASTGSWMEFGDLSTLGQLAYQDVVILDKGSGKNVLGASATFAAADSNVTFANESRGDVLGANATFQVDVPLYSANKTNIKATASDTAISGDASTSAITSLGTPTTDTFVKSVQAVTGKKLVTTTLQGVKGTAKSAQRVTATTKKLVTTTIKGVSGTEDVLQQVAATKSHLGIQNISQVTGNTDVTVQNVSNVGTASTWDFSVGNGTDAETLIISGTNSTTPTLDAAQTASKITNANVQVATGNLVSSGSGAEVATDVQKTYKTVATADATDTTVATGSLGSTGGDDIVDSVSMTEVTNLAELGETKTLATGTTDASGTGDSIVSDVQIGDTASAITNITPETAIFLQSVKVTQQPTINLSTGATAGTGVIEVATDVSSATNLQNVSVTNQDVKSVLQNVGTGTAAGQVISVTNQDVTKVALYDDLSVTVANE